MKPAILIAILISLAAPFAHAGFAAADDDASTDARANVVEACFGGCEKDNNQVNFTTSPYQVDKDYNTIMKDRGVIHPQDLENGEGKKEKTWDL